MNFEQIKKHLQNMGASGLAVPLLLLCILAMMVVPLAPFVLDMMFTINITLSIVVLMAVIYAMRPLDFNSFPSVLLFATLLRLSLNVASTRVVLLHGHDGPGAAGRVIEAFGEFVIGGNFAVGVVVFAILTIVNFMVVTKGAERVSEVSARFMLDSLPGRQMAIDADLNAGILTREQAVTKREEVRSEADFYGSMDGASKFVRGDAIAGILILFINIIGGMVIGPVMHDMPFSEALRTYTLLSIGDGLVAQVPALLLSTSVAVLVTRVADPGEMAKQIGAQLFNHTKVLYVTAGVLGLVGLVPGMPNFSFLTLAAVCAAAAWWMSKRARDQATTQSSALDQAALAAPKPAELSWDDVGQNDVLGLEVGYRLIPLVDTRQGGELMSRIKGIRKKLTHELGFLVPPVHIRDNLQLAPGAYRLLLNGVPVAESSVHPEREMALNPGRVFGKVEGIATKDPAFGLDAIWIEKGSREHAQSMGYTVVDCPNVIATHLSHVIKQHASELLGHDEAQALLDQLAKQTPKLVEDLVPKALSLSVFVKVLQNLLSERVPIRNLRVIAEALAESAGRTQDPAQLSGLVRVALGRQIVQDINGMDPELPVMTLAGQLEQVLQDSLKSGGAAIEPGLAERIHKSLSDQTRQLETSGQPAVLLVPPGLRPLLARFTRQTIPGLHVLAFDEVPESKQLKMIGAIS
ncbi:flagellar biosynthesis protein FlhA [Sinimarinibacterium sp. NLF-5-8]|uniref:flagellar biosynthesis protein FlhA n=1 Tax=Sinimarinibacterium sp. NLF-5-8 TaxID=2698684 RepID=UPI00137BB564|nr:flagellar biosynthesis protein FlhA [Sinimarinibacterium sp. NLF-5-8]QHS08708.1 flagellar biosynthesis protein FlhA [Sinimarinibacterium sp. NLF-5-8]